jgi:3-deoxy-7-phosphoheptulonate synthase
MIQKQLRDTNVTGYRELLTPRKLVDELLPLSKKGKEAVLQGREDVKKILRREDRRKLLIVGPCSIHDVNAAMEYAERLKELSERVAGVFLVVMRVYGEKPRTSVGWKGLINEPSLDGIINPNEGLITMRSLLVGLANKGIITGTEFVQLGTPQRIGDTISWSAIGARTVESPPHRHMASGLSMAVGFKNNTNGNVKAAIDAIITAAGSHEFDGINWDGVEATVTTKGNSDTHLVLRGSENQSNYDEESVRSVLLALAQRGLQQSLVVDCAHGNAMNSEHKKDHKLQSVAFWDLINQIMKGNEGITGVMLESFLEEGSQKFESRITRKEDLKYGVSITDPCIGWNETESMILSAAKELARR